MEDIKNNKYNNLLVLEPLYKYRREWVWSCFCDCGNTTKVRVSKLKNGTTKSCGCHKQKNIKAKVGSDHKGWAGYKDLSKSFFSRIKASANKRNLEFTVSITYLYDLYTTQKGLCAYTGESINLPINVKQLRGENNEDIASLDRIDNDKGYVEGNLQWVCKRVNYMKHTMKDDYFMTWIEKIYNYKYGK